MGKFFLSLHIPEDRLFQRMLCIPVPLCIEDVLEALGLQFNALQKQILTAFVFEAILAAFLVLATELCSCVDFALPLLPSINIFPCTKMLYHTMRPIFALESSIESNHCVLILSSKTN